MILFGRGKMNSPLSLPSAWVDFLCASVTSAILYASHEVYARTYNWVNSWKYHQSNKKCKWRHNRERQGGERAGGEKSLPQSICWRPPRATPLCMPPRIMSFTCLHTLCFPSWWQGDGEVHEQVQVQKEDMKCQAVIVILWAIWWLAEVVKFVVSEWRNLRRFN